MKLWISSILTKLMPVVLKGKVEVIREKATQLYLDQIIINTSKAYLICVFEFMQVGLDLAVSREVICPFCQHVVAGLVHREYIRHSDGVSNAGARLSRPDNRECGRTLRMLRFRAYLWNIIR